MNTIAGIFGLDGQPVPQSLSQRLLMALPGDPTSARELWQANGVALMEVRRDAIDAPAAPRVSGSDAVAVFEGRLDNRDELRRGLQGGGPTPVDMSDRQWVEAAYRAWGDELAARLLGDFAFAIWDGARRSLHLGVDAIGACPLFYVQTQGYFAFSTDEEALVALPGVGAAPNEAWIVNTLLPSYWRVGSADGWFRNISILPPGHSLTVEGRGARRPQPYWQWNREPESVFSCDAEAVEAFNEVFSEAVNCRLGDHSTTAQLLSGGLDSASILAASRQARQARGDPVNTYSAVADDPAADIESRAIEAMADGHTFRMNLPSFDGPVAWRDVVQEAWGATHPSDNSLLVAALLCRSARQDGRQAMLHGACGDLTQQVPSRYIAFLQREGRWRAAWHECTMASRNSTLLEGESPAKLFLQNLWTAAAATRVNRAVHRLRAPSIARMVANSSLHPDLAGRLRVRESLVEDQFRRRPPLPATAQDEVLASIGGPFGLALGLRGFARLGKRYGLQMRDPWADRRVVGFFLRLPLRQKVHDGWTKYVVRRSLDGVLPREVVWRRDKQHLGWLVTQRLLGPDGGNLVELLESASKYAAPYVRPTAIERARSYLAARSAGGDYSFVEHKLAYDLLVLGLWLRRVSNAA